MSKKSLLYIIIIICVLTSSFFLAGNYRSSIEMKNRGENIVPSVNDNKNLIIDSNLQFSHSMGDNCPDDFKDWNEDYTAFTCRCDSGIIYDDVCYDTQDEYCSAIRPGDVYVPDHGCMTPTTDEYCVAIGKARYYNGACRTQAEYDEMTCTDSGKYYTSDGRCIDKTTDEYCRLAGLGDKYYNGSCRTQVEYDEMTCTDSGKYYTSDGRCIDKTTDEYCRLAGLGDKYYNGQCITQAQYDKTRCEENGKYWTGSKCVNYDSDDYCIETNTGDIFVPGSGCMYKNTDPYCLATRGTHSSGGACRSNDDECVYLEGNGAQYNGTPNEKYSPTKCDSVADQCSRQGKVLYGSKCITYQQMCEDVRKGTWKNGTCVTNNNGGDGVSGKISNQDKNDNPKTDDVIGTDATLTDIVLSSGRLMFDFGTFDYRVEVSSNVESITIEPITTDPDATFVVNGDTKLKPGDNVFTIVVTAEDGTTTRTYNLTIVKTDRILSSNSKASLIEIANHEINFNKDQTEYEVDLDKDEDELDIKVTSEDNLSITEVLGNEGLENGDVVTVKVTAEDGSYTVYAIKVNKEVPFNIKDYIPYIVAGVAGLLLIIFGVAVLKGRKSNDEEDDKDKMKDDNEDNDFKMKSKE